MKTLALLAALAVPAAAQDLDTGSAAGAIVAQAREGAAAVPAPAAERLEWEGMDRERVDEAIYALMEDRPLADEDRAYAVRFYRSFGSPAGLEEYRVYLLGRGFEADRARATAGMRAQHAGTSLYLLDPAFGRYDAPVPEGTVPLDFDEYAAVQEIVARAVSGPLDPASRARVETLLARISTAELVRAQAKLLSEGLPGDAARTGYMEIGAQLAGFHAVSRYLLD